MNEIYFVVSSVVYMYICVYIYIYTINIIFCTKFYYNTNETYEYTNIFCSSRKTKN